MCSWFSETCFGIPKTDLQMKIVFIHNDGELGWHAFSSTDIIFHRKEYWNIIQKDGV